MNKKMNNKVRKLYSVEIMNKALELVKNGSSINSVSKMYNIPRSSLHSRVTNKYKGTKTGPPTVFSEEEENGLMQWILYMCSRGCPITKEHLINSMAIILNKSKKPNPFTNNCPGRHWYEGFLRRHPQLKIRLTENITISRALVTESNVREWFQNIQKFLKQENLENIDASRVFNADETSLLLNPKSGSVLAEKGTKNIYNIVGNNEKENITVVVNANAAGKLGPTMIVSKLERISSKIYSSLPTDFHIGRSDKGWMTAQLFYEYIANTFYPWIIKKKIQLPVILFLDGHVSHLTQPLSQFCYEHKIILIILPPNTTHFLQPLDVSLFSALKAMWRKHVNLHRIENEVLNIKKEDFAPTLNKVFGDMNLIEILKNGFKACGLHPFTPEAVDYSKIFIKCMENLEPESIETSPHNDTLCLQCFEKYIPLNSLKRFKENITNEWTGPVEDTHLFYVWQKIHNSCSKNDIDLSRQINQNDTYMALPSHDVCIESPVTSSTINEHNNRENVQLLEKDIGNVLNSEIILCNEGEEENENVFEFYIDDKGDVHPTDPLKLVKDSFKETQNEISILDDSNKTTSTTEGEGSSVLQEIQNLNQNNKKIPDQFKQFIFWPKDQNKPKKRHPKMKIPSVLSSEEGLQWYTEQEEKKRKIQEEKELRKKIRITNALIKKETAEKNKKQRQRKNKKGNEENL